MMGLIGGMVLDLGLILVLIIDIVVTYKLLKKYKGG